MGGVGKSSRRKKELNGGGRTAPEVFLWLWNALQRRVLPVVTAQ